ncbi:MAG: hypothetical protein LAQ69_22395 [Acidobacteriia bacterium]|nr:hypothetical protein [Terriglobia bacterium]
MGDQLPDTKVPDTQETFENRSQENAEEASDSQTAWEVNRKRSYDAYQHPDLDGIRNAQRFFETSAAQLQRELAAVNNITLQHLTNSVQITHKINADASDNVASTRAQVLKHADVAADALWTDELNPVTRGAGNDLTGEAPVNAKLAGTASLDVAFNNLTSQNGQLVAGYVTMAQALSTSNAAITANLAGLTAALAQMVQNMKQGGGAPAA